MFRNTYLKKFLIPGSLSATAITSAGDGESPPDNKDNLVRRTELPIYTDPTQQIEEKEENSSSNIEKGIGAVRKEIWVWHDNYKGYRERVVDVVVTAKEHTAVLVEQLRQDELPIPRSGAIAIGGLSGVILGLRGGWFKRIFYGSTCAGIMAAISYPKEVNEVTQDALGITKKYVMIAYNFIYGVKPEGLKLPSPSQLLGGPIESPEKAQSATAVVVSEKKETKPVTTSSTTPRPNDQSNPADKDLYSGRR